MKRFAIFWLTAGLTLCLGACRREPMATPTPQRTEPPAAEVTPTPTPELELDLEPWQAAYVEILRGYEVRRDGFASDIRDLYQENYTLYDIDKDGLPELFLIGGFDEASRSCQVYFWQDGFAIEAGGHQEGYMEGALDFWHGGLFTCPGENGVLWSRGYDYNKVSLIDGDLVGSSLNGTLSKDISTDEITADMFVPDAEGLCSYEPSDLQPILSYPAANVYGTNGETVELSRADFSVYPPVLSSGEQKALEDFLPVLTGKEPLIPDWNDGEKVLLTDWFKEMLSSEFGELPSVFTAFALCDLDGDGERELILWIDGYGGCYTILHREKGVFYGTYRSVRQFQELQTDGIYASTGGMGNRSYCRASFEDGKLLEKELGYTRYYGEDDLVHYFVGEKEVSEAEFETWMEEHLVGDAVWYAAREEKEEP